MATPNSIVLSPDLITRQRQSGLNLSAFLETEDPTSEYGPSERMDAFQRQLAKLDIRTASDPNTGIVAHPFNRFFENPNDKNDEGRFLAREWIMRQFRTMSDYWATHKRKSYHDVDGQRISGTIERLFDTEAPLSFTLFPPAVLPELRFIEIQPTMLPELLARTRTVAAETFYAEYLNDTAATAEARMYRVEQKAELPIITFDTSSHLVRNYKYGRRIQQTYEQMRRMSMDMVSWAIMYVAARNARDKEDAALYTIINGDGNASTAATSVNGSTYDTGGALTLKMWLNWRFAQFVRPYKLTTVVANPAAIVKLMLLSAGTANIAPAFYLQTSESGAVDITETRTTLEGIRMVDNTAMVNDNYVGIDKNAACEMVLEANSDIVETDRVISRQYTEIALSENVGFSIATLNQNQNLVATS